MSSNVSNATNVITLTGYEDYYYRVSQETRLILIDFSATWCGPCKKLGPYLDELSREFDNQVLILKMDQATDQTQAEDYRLFDLFGIESLPTVIGLKNGQLVGEKIIGFNPAKVKAMITTFG
jgi:thioredoxin 1